MQEHYMHNETLTQEIFHLSLYQMLREKDMFLKDEIQIQLQQMDQ
jgi:hypothetical protein